MTDREKLKRAIRAECNEVLEFASDAEAMRGSVLKCLYRWLSEIDDGFSTELAEERMQIVAAIKRLEAEDGFPIPHDSV